MKKIKLILAGTIILFSISLFAQKKGFKFEYKIAVKNAADGTPFAEGTVTWQAKIYELAKGKKLVWEEGSSDETNKLGLLKIKIGKEGTAHPPYSSFDEIDFGRNKYIVNITLLNENVTPRKLKPIKVNPILYALHCGEAYHSIKADTAKVALTATPDVDNDGVQDNIDKEPFSPKGAKVDKFGVSVDTDKDGVPDALDKEPNTKEGEIVNFQGISISAKISPSLPATTVAKGSDFLPVIFFEREFLLSPNNASLLFDVYNYLKANPTVKLKVIGHTDEIGSDEYNMRLGLRRAQAVIDALISLGIAEDRLIPESKGETVPLVDLTQFNLLNFNRRVHFEIAQ